MNELQTNIDNTYNESFGIVANSREKIPKFTCHHTPMYTSVTYPQIDPGTKQGPKTFSPHLEKQFLKNHLSVSVSIFTKGLLGVKMVLMELLPPPLLPLLGGLILFSFCRRLQNQTRITSFSMLSWSAIMVISSEVGFWFCLKRAKKPEIPCQH